MFFKMARPVCSRLDFKLIFKNVFFFFAFLTKNDEVQENFSKTPLNCCQCKRTNLGKKSFQYHQRILKKNEIENVLL